MGLNHRRLDVLRTGRGPVAEHVIDEFVAGRLSRREFLRRGSMIGLSVPLLGGILEACGSSSPSPGSSPAAKGKAGATIKAGIGVPGTPVRIVANICASLRRSACSAETMAGAISPALPSGP